MTLDEFQKRLMIQKNAQSQNLINSNLNTNEMSEIVKKVQSNRMQGNSNIKKNLITNNSDIKAVLKAPVSKTLNQTIGIDPKNLPHKNTFGENVESGLWGALHLSKPIAKIGLTAINEATPYISNNTKNIDNLKNSFKNGDILGGIKNTFKTGKDIILAPIDYISDKAYNGAIDTALNVISKKNNIDANVLKENVNKVYNEGNFNIVKQEKYGKVASADEVQKIVDEEYGKHIKNENVANVTSGISDIALEVSLASVGVPMAISSGVVGGLSTYGDTNDVKQIGASTARGVIFGALADGGGKIGESVLSKASQNYGKKYLATILGDAVTQGVTMPIASEVADRVSLRIIKGTWETTEEEERQINQSALIAGAIGILTSPLGSLSKVKKYKNSLPTVQSTGNIDSYSEAMKKLDEINYTLKNHTETMNNEVGMKKWANKKVSEILEGLDDNAIESLQKYFERGNPEWYSGINNSGSITNNVSSNIIQNSKNISSNATEKALAPIVNNKISTSNIENNIIGNINGITSSNVSIIQKELIDSVNSLSALDIESKSVLIEAIKQTTSESLLNEYIPQINEMIELQKVVDNKVPTKTETIKGSFINYSKEKIDNNVVDNALNLIKSNNQGKRTKEQWLQVAEQIGLNAPSDKIDIYANKTWLDLKPNQKSTLNRQGKSYVPFSKNEWINKVKEANRNDISSTDITTQDRLKELKSIDISDMGLIEKTNIKREIRALEAGYTNVEDYLKAEELKKEQAKLEYEKIPKNKITNVNEDSNIDYRMQHKPTKNGVGYDITSTDSIGKDIYTNPENYVDMSLKHNQESYKALVDIRDNPNAEVNIYRASPKNELNEGDWITLSKTYAEMESQKENVPVNEFKVKAKDIQFAGDDINEFGYFPQENILNIPIKKIDIYNSDTLEGYDIITANRILSTNRDVIIEDEKQLRNLVDEALQTNSNKALHLGKISKENTEYIKNNINNLPKDKINIINKETYDLIINQSEIRHLIEDKPSLSNEDVLKYVKFVPKIITESDYISYSKIKDEGLRFRKEMEDGTYISFATTSSKGTLKVHNIHMDKNDYESKKRSLYPTNNGIKPLDKTSETNGLSASINNIIPSEQNYVNNTKKTMNPIEIANLSKESVSSTPDIEFTKPIANGNKRSSFYKNITNNSKFLNKELRSALKTDADVEYYKGITNEDTLTKAVQRLDDGGELETLRWANKDKDFTAEDVTEGWILLKRYQDIGDYDSAIQIARKMRNIATNAGQTIQAFGIMNRLTPEGMIMYAQSELDEAFEKFSENKTKKWIDENSSKFQLTPDETQFIMDKVKEAQGYEKNSYEQKVALAEIQKVMTDKLPPERGQKIKSWMRISMLFNPKTQVRNVAGNAIIAPVNYAGDIVSSIVDKTISKKTGVRTIGTANVKAILKGLKKGATEATNDFRKGINTKSIDGNRFEISQGKSFSENNIIGKSLNRVEATLNYVMDVGDRVFSESWFENSLQNQMVLNNATEVTQEMIDIATQEALSRTWNDNNNYTKFVLNIRKGMNKLNIGGYGLGDILIPFAKTPANLTKAIVDYSPVGLVNSLKEGINLKNSIEKGTNTAMQQHQFVQNLGKAVAGTLLYIAGYALAKAGITTGDNDDDKDVANFMKNTLGVSSYSIKIGDKTFSYDWAQPISAPLSIMADIVKLEDSDAELYDKVLDVIDTPLNNIMEQSFMSSIQSVLNNRDNVTKGIAEAIEELPSRAIPTFVKQVADLVDGTQRQTYVKGKPIETAINKVKAKIPIVSKKLAPTVDTLGRESKKFGGNNGVFNVFFNPANFNTGLTTKSAEEIYKLYKQTGDKTIMPRVAGYSLTYKGKDYNLSTEERARYQKVMGKYVNDNVERLLSSKDYKKLSDVQKADIINEIVSDGAEFAKEDYANTYNNKNTKDKIEYERSKSDVKVDEEIKKGLSTANAYIYKTIISKKESDKDADDKAISNSSTKNKLKYIMDMEIDDSQKQHLINVSTNDTDYDVSVKDLKKLNGEYLTYLQQSGKQPEKGGMTAREEYMQLINSGISVKQLNKYYSEKGDIEGVKDNSGKTISGSKKQAIFNYVNSLSLSIPQKQILLARENESFAKLYYNDIINYINNLNISNTEKSKMYDAIFKKIK